jgi:hypothetical protein
MRDVQRILRTNKEVLAVTRELNAAAVEGIGEDMRDDLIWRAGHHRLDVSFWDLVTSDFQRQLSTGPSLQIDYSKSKLSILDVEKQTISSLPFFSSAQLVRYTFRSFHRSDGQ